MHAVAGLLERALRALERRCVERARDVGHDEARPCRSSASAASARGATARTGARRPPRAPPRASRSESSPRPLSARDAVDAETPAYSATSASVTFRPFPKRLRKRLRRCHSRLRRVKSATRLGVAGLGGMGSRPRPERAAPGRRRNSSRSPRPAPSAPPRPARPSACAGPPTTSCSPPTTWTRSCWRRARSTTPSTPAPCSRPASTSSSRSPARRRWPGRTRSAQPRPSTPSCVVQVGYHRRYDARWLEARRRVAEGAIGRPLARRRRRARRPDARSRRIRSRAGGFLVDMASHDYDAACWFLGQEPVEAYAARQSIGLPGARGARRSRQRRGHGSLRRRRHRRSAHLAHLPVGPRRPGGGRR